MIYQVLKDHCSAASEGDTWLLQQNSTPNEIMQIIYQSTTLFSLL